MKLSEIVKPSDIDEFLRLQLSCLNDELEKIQFLARIQHSQPHVKNQPTVELLVFYELSRSPTVELSFFVTDQADQVLSFFGQSMNGDEIAQQLNVAWCELKNGLSLKPVHIAKPWGQEIWYTGIEERGVSQVMSGSGVSPLDWVIAAAPASVLGINRTPILLKILDPLPDEVYGDLYFEMHEKKQEVYVVTQVDERAWPNGKGGIRFGFDQQRRATFSSDSEFRKAYLEAVIKYQQVRQHIDQMLDQKRAEQDIDKNEPVAPTQIKKWLEGVPESLLMEESTLRQDMEDFIAVKALRVGDVVKVPCYTPHSLQHGVQTIEFQTPVYERKILSFAQKVLTQDHWDTESALDQLLLDAPEDQALEILEQGNGLTREQVVRFDDFSVQRVTLEQGGRLELPGDRYRLLMLLSGQVDGRQLKFSEGAALLVPAQTAISLSAVSDKSVLLLAEPLVH